MVMIGVEANKVTVTETSGAFATEEDKFTDEPDIVLANIAGKDPVELGANTFPRASTSAASIASLKGKLTLGRRKASNTNLRIEFAAMFALNKN
jgi:hypothetical protein